MFFLPCSSRFRLVHWLLHRESLACTTWFTQVETATYAHRVFSHVLFSLALLCIRNLLIGVVLRIFLEVSEIDQLFLLFFEVSLPALLLGLSSDILLILVGVFARSRRIIWTIAIWVMQGICGLLLTLIISSFLLRTLLFHRVLHVLSFEVTFKLSELSLDFIFPILAYHLNGSQSLFGLA